LCFIGTRTREGASVSRRRRWRVRQRAVRRRPCREPRTQAAKQPAWVPCGAPDGAQGAEDAGCEAAGLSPLWHTRWCSGSRGRRLRSSRSSPLWRTRWCSGSRGRRLRSSRPESLVAHVILCYTIPIQHEGSQNHA